MVLNNRGSQVSKTDVSGDGILMMLIGQSTLTNGEMALVFLNKGSKMVKTNVVKLSKFAPCKFSLVEVHSFCSHQPNILIINH